MARGAPAEGAIERFALTVASYLAYVALSRRFVVASAEGRDPVIGVVSSQRVREAGGRAVVPVPGHEQCDEPVIELIRQGDVIQAIDITCPCGRRLRVLCDYQGTSES
jgi:hypothetical protein